MEGIAIVPFEKKHFPRFRDYIHAAFHKKYILGEERFLDWQYAPPGQLYLALHQGEIVGHFGFRDSLYKVYGESRQIRVAMNLFSLEKYHRAGVGPLLAKKVFAAPHPVLISGYNLAAHRLCAHLRKDWREAGNLTRFLAVFDPTHPFLKSDEPRPRPKGWGIRAGFVGKESAPPTQSIISPPSSPPQGAEMKEANSDKMPMAVQELSPPEYEIDIRDVIEFDTKVTESLKAFWREARDRYPVTIERTGDYLRWRFFQHPYFRYSFLIAVHNHKIVGYLCYRSDEAEGFFIARIIDFVADASAELPLLRHFRERAAKDHHAADFMFSGSFYRDSLNSAGFFDPVGTDFEYFPIRFNPVSYQELSVNTAYDVRAPLRDFFITKADSDQDRPNPH